MSGHSSSVDPFGFEGSSDLVFTSRLTPCSIVSSDTLSASERSEVRTPSGAEVRSKSRDAVRTFRETASLRRFVPLDCACDQGGVRHPCFSASVIVRRLLIRSCHQRAWGRGVSVGPSAVRIDQSTLLTDVVGQAIGTRLPYHCCRIARCIKLLGTREGYWFGGFQHCERALDVVGVISTAKCHHLFKMQFCLQSTA